MENYNNKFDKIALQTIVPDGVKYVSEQYLIDSVAKMHLGLYICANGVILRDAYTDEREPVYEIVKQSNANGYRIINHNGKTYLVHRLVALMFCRGYKSALVVDHIDCCKSNNNHTNLRWCTQEQNIQYAKEYYHQRPGTRKGGRPQSDVPTQVRKAVTNCLHNYKDRPDYMQKAKKCIQKIQAQHGNQYDSYLNDKLLK